MLENKDYELHLIISWSAIVFIDTATLYPRLSGYSANADSWVLEWAHYSKTKYMSDANAENILY